MITQLKSSLRALSTIVSRRRVATYGGADVVASSPAAGDRPSNSGLGSFLSALPDASVLLDSNLMVLAANKSADDIFGRVVVGDHVGRSIRHPDLMDALKSTQRTRQSASLAIELRTPTERHLDCTVASVSGLGSPSAEPRILAVFQDISEREALARMRVEFIANASHELRTPLTALSGFIETLQGPAQNNPATRQRFLAIMSEQAQRMTRLIDDLLLLSRVEMRAHVVPVGIVDLALVAKDAVQQVAAAVSRERAHISIVNTAGSATLPGDHDELVQAVQNLLSNALKYGKPAGTIELRIADIPAKNGGGVQLSVTDDGPGIAPEHLPRLTERFYRVNTPASREKGGTGLGLAIVKHIAARHRGRVVVTSKPGVETTFKLMFPAVHGRS